MKKVLVIMLALLMLVASAATAESALVVSDPVLTANMGGEMKIDLTGLALKFIVEADGEIPMVRIEADGQGQTLATLDVNILGDKVILALSGVEGAYSMPMPAAEAVSSVANLDLSGLDIDFEALMMEVMGEIEMTQDEDTMTFKVPYTAVNKVLAALAPALDSVSIPGADASEIRQALEQLEQQDAGIQLEGSLTQSETGMVADLTAKAAQGGQVAPDALLTAHFEMGEANAALQIAVQQVGTLYFEAAPVGEAVQVRLGLDSTESSFDLTTNILVSEEEAALVPIANADAAVDLLSLSDEEAQELANQAMMGNMGLLGFLGNALGALENAA